MTRNLGVHDSLSRAAEVVESLSRTAEVVESLSRSAEVVESTPGEGSKVCGWGNKLLRLNFAEIRKDEVFKGAR